MTRHAEPTATMLAISRDPEALRINLALEADGGPLNHIHIIGGAFFDVLTIAETVVAQAEQIAQLGRIIEGQAAEIAGLDAERANARNMALEEAAQLLVREAADYAGYNLRSEAKALRSEARAIRALKAAA